MKRNILLLIMIAGLFSCTKDQSAYQAQQKEDVKPGDLFNPDGPDDLPAGYLKAGMNKVSLEVTLGNGDKSIREFKYYFPISINPNKPISLVFNFHGSYTYAAGTPPPDPILNISLTDPLNRLADTANIITVWPAGTAETGAVNWQFSEKHIPFVKAMIAFFKSATPAVDPNRIYSCGHSSGAIFSFVLAHDMSDVFAAVCPVSGQMKLSDNTPPQRTVPVRAFNGQKDATVSHSAAYGNIQAWADIMGGYYVKDSIAGQKNFAAATYTIVPYKWGGGNGSVEFYSIPEADHGINWNNIITLMWEFMRANPLDKPTGIYVGAKQSSLVYEIGKTYTIELRSSKGVAVRVASKPVGIDAVVNGNALEITVQPTAVNGKIVLEGALNGVTKNTEITLSKL